MNARKLMSMLIFFAAFKVSAQQTSLYDTTSRSQLISKQFSFTEGASVDKKGNVFFTDQPNNQIWEYSTEGKLSLWLDNAGRSNGMYFDSKGNLISCADEHGQLWSISPDKKVKVLMTDFGGKQMNGPNDCWVDPKGGIYMTDPYYQRDYWTRKKTEMDGQKVYYLPKGKKQPIPVDGSLKQPNGIVGTPDGKYLFVADIGDNKMYKFTIEKDGMLSNRTLFVPQGGDGLTLDEKGNLYIAGNGVTIYDPTGNKIGHIPVPEPWTANLCFGGVNKDILFMTASKAFYMLKMNVKGVE